MECENSVAVHKLLVSSQHEICSNVIGCVCTDYLRQVGVGRLFFSSRMLLFLSGCGL